MAYNYEYPYVDPYRVNNDWMLKQIQTILNSIGSDAQVVFDTVADMIAGFTGGNCITRGFWEIGDGGGAIYYYSATNPLDSNVTDATGVPLQGYASFILSNGGYAVLQTALSGELNAKQLGFGYNSLDASPQITNVIQYLLPDGGTLYFPGGTYILGSQITIGNGLWSSGASAVQASTWGSGLHFVGDGSGAGYGRKQVTRFYWTGGDGGTVILLAGGLTSVVMRGFEIDNTNSNHADYCIRAYGCTASRFEDIYILGAGTTAFEVHGAYYYGGQCSSCDFKDIFIVLYDANSIGLDLDGYSGYSDVWQCIFENVRVQGQSGSDGSTGIRLAYSDSCTFIRCHSVTYGDGFTGALFDGSTIANFPAGHCFHDCSIINSDFDTTHSFRQSTMLNAGTYDLETLPTNTLCNGVTETGIPFNGYGTIYNPVTQLGLTQATTTRSAIATAISNLSAGATNCTIALWYSSYSGFDWPSAMTSGSYVLLKVYYGTINNITFILHDLVNNNMYISSKYGGVLTDWKLITAS